MNWWHYLLLVNIYLTLFYSFYVLMLRRETFFQLNRIYLVSTALLSFFIPLIQSDWIKNLFITQQVQYAVYNSGAAIIIGAEPVKDAPYTLGEFLVVCYLIGAVVLSVRLAAQLMLIKRVINNPSPSAAYSFFKKINVGDDVPDKDVILKHEQVHARQWHSADVLVIEFVMIINWFNPVVYFYRYAIKHIHEFIADQHALKEGTDKTEYALLLLSQTFAAPSHQLLNPFFNSGMLKERILMLQKSKSARIKLAKYGLSAPLFIMMLVLSSATINNSNTIKIINTKASQVMEKPASSIVLLPTIDAPKSVLKDTARIAQAGGSKVTVISTGPDKTRPAQVISVMPATQDTLPAGKNAVYAAVEHQPSFPGGIDAFSNYLAANVKYPVIARENNVQGRVIVRFVVEKNGSLSDVKVIRGIGSGADEEAVRVLKASPKWNPGMQKGTPVRTQYTVPVNFALSADSPAEASAGDVAQNINQVFTAVEWQPTFPGGEQAFQRFLASNIKYPAKARANKTEGRVIATFVIEKDGSLTGIKIIRGIGDGADEEAARVLSLSPKWKPGVQNGKPVRVQYSVPINFWLGTKAPDTRTGSVWPQNNNYVKSYNLLDTTRVNQVTFTLRDGQRDGSEPLVILNDKVIPYSELKALNSSVIKSVTVYKKDEKYNALYGKRAANGVIVIKTKL